MGGERIGEVMQRKPEHDRGVEDIAGGRRRREGMRAWVEVQSQGTGAGAGGGGVDQGRLRITFTFSVENERLRLVKYGGGGEPREL